MPKKAIATGLALASTIALSAPRDTNCMWVQAYTDTKLESCQIAPDGMLLVPKRAIDRRTANDLLLTATVATGMQGVPQPGISVALDPTLKAYLRVEGSPVQFRAQEGKEREARAAFEKRIFRCQLKANLDTACSNGSSSKLRSID